MVFKTSIDNGVSGIHHKKYKNNNIEWTICQPLKRTCISPRVGE